MILSPQAENTEAFEIDESASTPHHLSTSYHLAYYEFAAWTLPSSSPPPEKVVSLCLANPKLEFYKLVENYGRFGQKISKEEDLEDLLQKIKITEDIS
ncbi:hypothetical protein Tco_1446738 [Tanacetum coccineum]